MRLLGAHVSAAGGVDKAVERVSAIGGNCVQVFSGSPRVWVRPNLENIDVNKIYSKMNDLNVESIFTHSLYLINFASENPELQQKSIDALSFDLRFDAHIKGSGVVVHLGSHKGSGWQTVQERVAKLLGQVLANTPDHSQILIENAASQNGKIGGKLAEIRWLLDVLQSDRVGWCFDTCHGSAAGLSLNPDAPQSALQVFQELQLVDSLKCIHVNDSRDPFMSGRDRHANLGEGTIPLEDMKSFVCHPLLADKPLILEVPGQEKEGPDKINMDRLKELVG